MSVGLTFEQSESGLYTPTTPKIIPVTFEPVQATAVNFDTSGLSAVPDISSGSRFLNTVASPGYFQIQYPQLTPVRVGPPFEPPKPLWQKILSPVGRSLQFAFGTPLAVATSWIRETFAGHPKSWKERLLIGIGGLEATAVAWIGALGGAVAGSFVGHPILGWMAGSALANIGLNLRGNFGQFLADVTRNLGVPESEFDDVRNFYEGIEAISVGDLDHPYVSTPGKWLGDFMLRKAAENGTRPEDLSGVEKAMIMGSGIVLDIILDPATYFTGGASSVSRLKGLRRLIGLAGEETVETVIRGTVTEVSKTAAEEGLKRARAAQQAEEEAIRRFRDMRNGVSPETIADDVFKNPKPSTTVRTPQTDEIDAFIDQLVGAQERKALPRPPEGGPGETPPPSPKEPPQPGGEAASPVDSLKAAQEQLRQRFAERGMQDSYLYEAMRRLDDRIARALAQEGKFDEAVYYATRAKTRFNAFREEIQKPIEQRMPLVIDGEPTADQIRAVVAQYDEPAEEVAQRLITKDPDGFRGLRGLGKVAEAIQARQAAEAAKPSMSLIGKDLYKVIDENPSYFLDERMVSQIDELRAANVINDADHQVLTHLLKYDLPFRPIVSEQEVGRVGLADNVAKKAAGFSAGMTTDEFTSFMMQQPLLTPEQLEKIRQAVPAAGLIGVLMQMDIPREIKLRTIKEILDASEKLMKTAVVGSEEGISITKAYRRARRSAGSKPNPEAERAALGNRLVESLGQSGAINVKVGQKTVTSADDLLKELSRFSKYIADNIVRAGGVLGRLRVHFYKAGLSGLAPIFERSVSKYLVFAYRYIEELAEQIGHSTAVRWIEELGLEDKFVPRDVYKAIQQEYAAVVSTALWDMFQRGIKFQLGGEAEHLASLLRRYRSQAPEAIEEWMTVKEKTARAVTADIKRVRRATGAAEQLRSFMQQELGKAINNLNKATAERLGQVEDAFKETQAAVQKGRDAIDAAESLIDELQKITTGAGPESMLTGHTTAFLAHTHLDQATKLIQDELNNEISSMQLIFTEAVYQSTRDAILEVVKGGKPLSVLEDLPDRIGRKINEQFQNVLKEAAEELGITFPKGASLEQMLAMVLKERAKRVIDGFTSETDYAYYVRIGTVTGAYWKGAFIPFVLLDDELFRNFPSTVFTKSYIQDILSPWIFHDFDIVLHYLEAVERRSVIAVEDIEFRLQRLFRLVVTGSDEELSRLGPLNREELRELLDRTFNSEVVAKAATYAVLAEGRRVQDVQAKLSRLVSGLEAVFSAIDGDASLLKDFRKFHPNVKIEFRRFPYKPDAKITQAYDDILENGLRPLADTAAEYAAARFARNHLELLATVRMAVLDELFASELSDAVKGMVTAKKKLSPAVEEILGDIATMFSERVRRRLERIEQNITTGPTQKLTFGPRQAVRLQDHPKTYHYVAHAGLPFPSGVAMSEEMRAELARYLLGLDKVTDDVARAKQWEKIVSSVMRGPMQYWYDVLGHKRTEIQKLLDDLKRLRAQEYETLKKAKPAELRPKPLEERLIESAEEFQKGKADFDSRFEKLGFDPATDPYGFQDVMAEFGRIAGKPSYIDNLLKVSKMRKGAAEIVAHYERLKEERKLAGRRLTRAEQRELSYWRRQLEEAEKTWRQYVQPSRRARKVLPVDLARMRAQVEELGNRLKAVRKGDKAAIDWVEQNLRETKKAELTTEKTQIQAALKRSSLSQKRAEELSRRLKVINRQLNDLAQATPEQLLEREYERVRRQLNRQLQPFKRRKPTVKVDLPEVSEFEIRTGSPSEALELSQNVAQLKEVYRNLKQDVDKSIRRLKKDKKAELLEALRPVDIEEIDQVVRKRAKKPRGLVYRLLDQESEKVAKIAKEAGSSDNTIEKIKNLKRLLDHFQLLVYRNQELERYQAFLIKHYERPLDIEYVKETAERLDVPEEMIPFRYSAGLDPGELAAIHDEAREIVQRTLANPKAARDAIEYRVKEIRAVERHAGTQSQMIYHFISALSKEYERLLGEINQQLEVLDTSLKSSAVAKFDIEILDKIAPGLRSQVSPEAYIGTIGREWGAEELFSGIMATYLGEDVQKGLHTRLREVTRLLELYESSRSPQIRQIRDILANAQHDYSQLLNILGDTKAEAELFKKYASQMNSVYQGVDDIWKKAARSFGAKRSYWSKQAAAFPESRLDWFPEELKHIADYKTEMKGLKAARETPMWYSREEYYKALKHAADQLMNYQAKLARRYDQALGAARKELWKAAANAAAEYAAAEQVRKFRLTALSTLSDLRKVVWRYSEAVAKGDVTAIRETLEELKKVAGVIPELRQQIREVIAESKGAKVGAKQLGRLRDLLDTLDTRVGHFVKSYDDAVREIDHVHHLFALFGNDLIDVINTLKEYKQFLISQPHWRHRYLDPALAELDEVTTSLEQMFVLSPQAGTIVGKDAKEAIELLKEQTKHTAAVLRNMKLALAYTKDPYNIAAEIKLLRKGMRPIDVIRKAQRAVDDHVKTYVLETYKALRKEAQRIRGQVAAYERAGFSIKETIEEVQDGYKRALRGLEAARSGYIAEIERLVEEMRLLMESSGLSPNDANQIIRNLEDFYNSQIASSLSGKARSFGIEDIQNGILPGLAGARLAREELMEIAARLNMIAELREQVRLIDLEIVKYRGFLDDLVAEIRGRRKGLPSLLDYLDEDGGKWIETLEGQLKWIDRRVKDGFSRQQVVDFLSSLSETEKKLIATRMPYLHGRALLFHIPFTWKYWTIVDLPEWVRKYGPIRLGKGWEEIAGKAGGRGGGKKPPEEPPPTGPASPAPEEPDRPGKVSREATEPEPLAGGGAGGGKEPPKPPTGPASPAPEEPEWPKGISKEATQKLEKKIRESGGFVPPYPMDNGPYVDFDVTEELRQGEYIGEKIARGVEKERGPFTFGIVQIKPKSKWALRLLLMINHMYELASVIAPGAGVDAPAVADALDMAASYNTSLATKVFLQRAINLSQRANFMLEDIAGKVWRELPRLIFAETDDAQRWRVYVALMLDNAPEWAENFISVLRQKEGALAAAVVQRSYEVLRDAFQQYWNIYKRWYPNIKEVPFYYHRIVEGLAEADEQIRKIGMIPAEYRLYSRVGKPRLIKEPLVDYLKLNTYEDIREFAARGGMFKIRRDMAMTVDALRSFEHYAISVARDVKERALFSTLRQYTNSAGLPLLSPLHAPTDYQESIRLIDVIRPTKRIPSAPVIHGFNLARGLVDMRAVPTIQYLLGYMRVKPPQLQAVMRLLGAVRAIWARMLLLPFTGYHLRNLYSDIRLALMHLHGPNAWLKYFWDLIVAGYIAAFQRRQRLWRRTVGEMLGIAKGLPEEEEVMLRLAESTGVVPYELSSVSGRNYTVGATEPISMVDYFDQSARFNRPKQWQRAREALEMSIGDPSKVPPKGWQRLKYNLAHSSWMPGLRMGALENNMTRYAFFRRQILERLPGATEAQKLQTLLDWSQRYPTRIRKIAEAAADSVRDVFFDYDELSQVERAFRRTVSPFYTWLRKNLSLQAQRAALQPIMYKAYSEMIYMIHNLLLSEEQYQMLGPTGQYLGFGFTDDPERDLERLATLFGAIARAVRGAREEDPFIFAQAPMLRPAIGMMASQVVGGPYITLAEILFGRSLGGRTFDGNYVPAGGLIRHIPGVPKRIVTTGYTMTGKPVREMVPAIPDWLAHLLRSGAPGAGRFPELIEAPKGPSNISRELSSALLGIRVPPEVDYGIIAHRYQAKQAREKRLRYEMTGVRETAAIPKTPVEAFLRGMKPLKPRRRRIGRYRPRASISPTRSRGVRIRTKTKWKLKTKIRIKKKIKTGTR